MITRRQTLKAISAGAVVGLTGNKRLASLDRSNYRLPPHIVNEKMELQSVNLWNLPTAVFNPIWGKVTGRRVKLGIIDTGIANHSLLKKPRSIKNFSTDSTARDGNGHGTHVASIATGRNGFGVAPDAELYIAKALSDNGFGSGEDVIAAVKWLREQKVDVINMSLGMPTGDDKLRDEIRKAEKDGIIVIVAAGNAGQKPVRDTTGYPARYDDCTIAVAATKGPWNNQQIADFSSAGPCVDVAAPGESIIGASIDGPTKLISLSGTSMASPYVAGLICLKIELDRKLGKPRRDSVEEIISDIRKATKDKGAPGVDRVWGNGLIQPSRLLSEELPRRFFR